jgi:HlyD family secretion protein
MSAFTSPSTQPLETPTPLAPAPAPPRGEKPLRRRIALVLGLVAVIGALALYQIRGKPQQAGKGAQVQIRTAPVTAGTLEITLRVAGTTSARDFATIACPMLRAPDLRNLELIQLAKSGSYVKKGDLVAEIDSQTAKDHVDDVDSQVQQAQSDIKKRMAEQQIELENLRQTLRTAKAELDKARLDAGASPIRTPIDIELLKLNVEEAEAEYKQLQTDVPNTEAKLKAEIRILELTRDRHARHRDRHAGDIKKLVIRTPLSGLVVMQSTWRASEMRQFQEGDQIHPGEPFMKVVDPSSMQVDATVNQVEAEQMRIGQAVTVEFDAFPDLRLPGRVYAIGAMAVGGWRQNYYIRNIPVRIMIEGRDERVIPDLSAAANIGVGRKENVLLIPLSAVRTQGSTTTVEVRTAGGFEKRAVELGARSFTHAEVLSGLRAGEQIVVGRS